jgi:hypothetical protein
MWLLVKTEESLTSCNKMYIPIRKAFTYVFVSLFYFQEAVYA